jgi:UDP-galactose transporter B1
MGAGRRLELVIAAGGIYVCYLYYGVLQNELYLKQADGTKFADTAFVLMVQCAVNAAIAAVTNEVAKLLPKEKKEGSGEEAAAARKAAAAAAAARPPFWQTLRNPSVMAVAAAYVFAMYTSNEALKYVSYVYQALAKSCKLIPVMIGSILIGGKRYSPIKYACVAGMTLGITAYYFAEDGDGGKGKGGHGGGGGGGGGGGSDEAWGLLLLAVSLALDGASGPGQETLKGLMSNGEQTMATNLWALLYMGIVAAALGQWGHAVSAGGGGGGGLGCGRAGALRRLTHHSHTPLPATCAPADHVPARPPRPVVHPCPLLPVLRRGPDLHLLHAAQL